MAATNVFRQLERWFSGCFGAFLGLSLLKFGNPVIMERFVTVPTDIYEFVLGFPWPTVWAYCLMAGLIILGFNVGRLQNPAPRWLKVLPAVWLGWQALSAAQSVDGALSAPTVKHFAACTACFYLGLYVLARVGAGKAFWVGLLGSLLVVLVVGWQQHFGGLKETREYFFAYIYPGMKEVPPEYLKKVSSDRIFSTLFYPNTLAGALLLLSPVLFLQVWRLGRYGRMTTAARSLLLGVVALGALACLYWSGSKGGWLLMLFIGLLALWHAGVAFRTKAILIVVLAVLGVVGFTWKYAGFFERGATSVGARFDYWRAALTTTLKRPFLGSGPGTFAVTYAELKGPESEMARLAHNDYLQQGADSGVPAAVLYAALMGGGLWVSRRSLKGGGWGDTSPDAARVAVWLGVLGYAVQGLVEFGLYIPALSWTAFALLGWLLGQKVSVPGAASGQDARQG